MSDKWDGYFLKVALMASSMSKDPSTKVGAVMVRDRVLLSTGFNGFPRGIADDWRLEDRDTKLKLIVHGEMNAVLNAARVGRATEGSTLYIACTDASGAIWGGPPCSRCAVEVIQAGIRKVVSFPQKTVPSRWVDDLNLARSILFEAQIIFEEVPLPRDETARS